LLACGLLLRLPAMLALVSPGTVIVAGKSRRKTVGLAYVVAVNIGRSKRGSCLLQRMWPLVATWSYYGALWIGPGASRKGKNEQTQTWHTTHYTLHTHTHTNTEQ